MDLRHRSPAFGLASARPPLLSQDERHGDVLGPRRGKRAADACRCRHADDAACGAPRSGEKSRLASKAGCGRGCEPGIVAVARHRVLLASWLAVLDLGSVYGLYAAWTVCACSHQTHQWW